MVGKRTARKTEKNNDYIQWANDESSLLLRLIDRFQQLDPDIIIGWNVINFDFRLLLERANIYNIDLSLGRDNGHIHLRASKKDRGKFYIALAGRIVIDGIDALKTATYSFTSFSLENVSRQLLKRGKKTSDVDSRAQAIEQDFHHNKEKLAAYNLEDCILVWDVFVKTKLLDFMRLRSQLTGLTLNKQGGSVAAFINLYLPKVHRAGYISPNLPAHGGLSSPGGYVMDSKPGLYEHVLVLDYKSLYPAIIRTFKIDPIGMIEGLKILKANNDENKNAKEAHDNDFCNDACNNLIPGFRGAVFSKHQHFLPGIIDELWQQRDKAKASGDAARSQALKIIMNSFYGVLGSGGCPFYDTRLASSITMRGHEIIQQTNKWIESLGYSVIYGDTDSIFVLLETCKSEQQAEDIGIALKNEINDNWQYKLREEFDINCYLELEFEIHFSRFFMPTIRGTDIGSKKRYAGLTKSPDKETIIFKGLESVRTDWTALAKDFQEQIYHAIFYDQSPEPIIQKILAETLSGKRDEQLIYRKRLRRNLEDYTKNIPPHVRAAKLADYNNMKNNKPLRYQHKGLISYIITNQGPQVIEQQSARIDYEHYIDKQLKPIADAILAFIGLSFDKITSKQMGLF